MQFWSGFLSFCGIERNAVNDLIQTKVIESTFKHYLIAHHGKSSVDAGKSKVKLFSNTVYVPVITICSTIWTTWTTSLFLLSIYIVFIILCTVQIGDWFVHNSRQLGYWGSKDFLHGNIRQALWLVLLLGFCGRLFQDVARPITHSYVYLLLKILNFLF